MKKSFLMGSAAVLCALTLVSCAQEVTASEARDFISKNYTAEAAKAKYQSGTVKSTMKVTKATGKLEALLTLADIKVGDEKSTTNDAYIVPITWASVIASDDSTTVKYYIDGTSFSVKASLDGQISASESGSLGLAGQGKGTYELTTNEVGLVTYEKSAIDITVNGESLAMTTTSVYTYQKA